MVGPDKKKTNFTLPNAIFLFLLHTAGHSKLQSSFQAHFRSDFPSLQVTPLHYWIKDRK